MVVHVVEMGVDHEEEMGVDHEEEREEAWVEA